MIRLAFFDEVPDNKIGFAVILARSGGRWVLCKHRDRATLEVPGGHREPGETVEETARRELYEETGATEFTLRPVCVYSVETERDINYGGLYFAEIRAFEPELHSEIERIYLLDEPPENWTYPEIQPKLMAEAVRRGIITK